MPRKKVNWELEWFKIHNPPEEFYFEFGKTVLRSNNLFHTLISTYAVESKKAKEDTIMEDTAHIFEGYMPLYEKIES